MYVCTCMYMYVCMYVCVCMYSTYQMQLKRQTRFTDSVNVCTLNWNVFIVKPPRVHSEMCMRLHARMPMCERVCIVHMWTWKQSKGVWLAFLGVVRTLYVRFFPYPIFHFLSINPYNTDICDISPLRGSQCVPSITMHSQCFVISVRHKPMMMAKKVDGFSASFWPK